MKRNFVEISFHVFELTLVFKAHLNIKLQNLTRFKTLLVVEKPVVSIIKMTKTKMQFSSFLLCCMKFYL